MTPDETISTVILTRDRRESLAAAVRSVARQNRVKSRVVIVGDEVSDWDGTMELVRSIDATAIGRNVARRPYPSVSARLSALRNAGVREFASDWVSFLDDDNEYAPEHLERLALAAGRSGSDAAHSWRRILNRDSTPWDGRRFPWPTPGWSNERALGWLRDEGVIVDGDGVFRDRAVMSNGRPGTVDTSEWLVRRSVVERCPWPEDVTTDQERGGISEDGLWLRRLIESRVSMTCSAAATLTFRLGGRFDGR